MHYYWKEASSVIITALKPTLNTLSANYLLLTLERSSKSSFMPKGIVFPGGKTHNVDSSKKWIDLFPDFVLKYYEALTLSEIPPILHNNEFQHIPKLLSLKITAIRETFEETGILLCCDNNKSSKFQHWASYFTVHDINEWRCIVQNNPSKFLSLCKQFNCYPDVLSLHLWSNWLTPSSMGSKRFDTVFFLASLKKIPPSAADNIEIENLYWETPDKLLKSYKNTNIWLPPPQFYELSRILQFNDGTKINEFAYGRSKEGCQRWMPQQIQTLDGFVSILPGDDAYNAVDFCNPTKISNVQITTQEFRLQSNVLHRIELINSFYGNIVVKNYKPVNGHKLPITNLSAE